MKDEIFVENMKELYPMAYESLVDDFERNIKRKLKYEKELKKIKK